MFVSGLNWLDVLSGLLLFLFVMQGMRTGFVLQFFGLLQVVLSYIVAVSYFPYLAEFFNNVLSMGNLLDELFDFSSAMIEGIGNILVSIAAFLILFFITRLIVRLIGTLVGIGTFLPIIGSINRVLGAVMGLIKGVLILAIIMAVMYVLPWEFIQESLWESQVFKLSLKLWPQLLLMLEDALNLNLPALMDLE